MRRSSTSWSWKETAVAVFSSTFLAAGAWLAVAAAPVGGPMDVAVETGAAVFRRERCFFCHTVTGEPSAATSWITQSGPDLRAAGPRSDDWHVAHLLHPEAVVAGSTMPSFQRLPQEELTVLVAYLQSLAPSTASPPTGEAAPVTEFSLESYRQGRGLFGLHCAGCHGPQGRGNGLVGPVLAPEPRDLTDGAWLSKQSDARLFAVVSEGLPETAMPGYREILTPAERMVLVQYLRTFGDPLARQFLEQGIFYPVPTP